MAGDKAAAIPQADLESEIRVIAAYRDRVRAIAEDVLQIPRQELDTQIDLEFATAPGADRPDPSMARGTQKAR